ncbi:TetR/AcrR family transcriptional regulator [Edaphocola aurantiacus]|jgi:AcrR family transcriptional regulator|uniref:TetR/AcrR family transcriptional regulator n=2 Tax=Edaphocola TaxID=2601681 RepID=UPI00100A273D|nr:TetR/AcrR family transcriptional regulator [Edaphocola aurantiacus]
MKTMNKESQEKVTKARKVTDGAIRNKARTKRKLLDAVGEVLRTKGYTGLTIRNIIETAGVDRRLIYLYFGGVDQLIETYLNEKDYWMSQISPKTQAIMEAADNFGQNEITAILHTMFDEVFQSADLQKILNWEISEFQPRLRELADNREELGKHLFKLTDANFAKTDINLRAMMAVQIAGIYYLILHALSNGSTFCEIDLNAPKGRKAIKTALSKMMELIYKEAESQK